MHATMGLGFLAQKLLREQMNDTVLDRVRVQQSPEEKRSVPRA